MGASDTRPRPWLLCGEWAAVGPVKASTEVDDRQAACQTSPFAVLGGSLLGPALCPACPAPVLSLSFPTAPIQTLVCSPTKARLCASAAVSLWPTLLLRGTCHVSTAANQRHLRGRRRTAGVEKLQPASWGSGGPCVHFRSRAGPVARGALGGGPWAGGQAPVAHAPPRVALSAPARFTASRTPTGSW